MGRYLLRVQPRIATVEASTDDPAAATAFITDFRFVDIEGTVNDIPGTYPIEVSDSVDFEADAVVPSTGPGS